jgi:S1-C subfamily serine protease
MGMVLSGQADGILVESVSRGSRADRAGLRPGDLLTEASGIPLEGLFSLHMAGTKVHDADEPLVFTVLRGGKIFTADLGRLGKPRSKVKPKAKPETPAQAAPNPPVTPTTEAR